MYLCTVRMAAEPSNCTVKLLGGWVRAQPLSAAAPRGLLLAGMLSPGAGFGAATWFASLAALGLLGTLALAGGTTGGKAGGTGGALSALSMGAC